MIRRPSRSTRTDTLFPYTTLFRSVEPFGNATIEAFYQYEWEPLEAPAPGSYFSFLDVGSRNAVDHASVSFGGAAEDPESLGLLLDNPRSEERRVGKECVSTCRSRWAPYH